MTKYGGYTLIAIAVLVFIYRFDIIFETLKGTENIPYYQLLTPAALLVAGVIIVQLKSKKEKK
ncbi:MAG: hypothetical protein ABFS16_03695 [Bacteroidota bacterium]